MSTQIDSDTPHIVFTAFCGPMRTHKVDMVFTDIPALKELREAYKALWSAEQGRASRADVSRWASYIDELTKRIGD